MLRLSLLLFFLSLSQLSQGQGIQVFISSSMPEASLKQWLEQSKKAKVPVLMRGFIENNFAKTVITLRALALATGNGVEINPEQFTKYVIDKVPAVVIDDGDYYVTIYDDVGLEYVLEKVNQQYPELEFLVKSALQAMEL